MFHSSPGRRSIKKCKMFVTIPFIYILCIFISVDAKSQVQSSVEGDQTVGGVHLFEVHTSSGGIGIGIKILVVVIIMALILWWCCRKGNKCANLYLKPAREVALAATAASAARSTLPELTYQQETCRHCRRHQRANRGRRSASADSSGAHLSP